MDIKKTRLPIVTFEAATKNYEEIEDRMNKAFAILFEEMLKQYGTCFGISCGEMAEHKVDKCGQDEV